MAFGLPLRPRSALAISGLAREVLEQEMTGSVNTSLDQCNSNVMYSKTLSIIHETNVSLV